LMVMVFLLVGGAGPKLVNFFLNSMIVQNLLLVNGNQSTAYPGWVDSIPLNYSFYMFNVTNVPDVLNGSIPILQQVGPYCYTMNKTHFDVEFAEDNSYCSAYTCYQYFQNFIHPECRDATTDYVTVVNGPWAAVRADVEDTETWWKGLAFDLLSSVAHEGPFTSVHPHDMFWGFDAPFLVFINDKLSPMNTTNFGLKFNCSSQEAQRNHSKKPDQYWTGTNDTTRAFWYKEWEGMSSLSYWGGGDSSLLYGTDGTSFHPNLLTMPPLTIFADGIFRHVNVVANSTVVIKGITMNDYQVNVSDFGNVSTNPNYYLYGPPGLINITQPLKETTGIGVPMFISKPYFLSADPYYGEQVQFLDEPEDVDSHFYIEPYTGVMMHGARKLQINVRIKESFLLYPQLKETVFPLCWTILDGMVSDTQADQFKDSVYYVLWITDIIQISAFVGAGLFLLFVMSMAIYLGTCQERRVTYEIIN